MKKSTLATLGIILLLGIFLFMYRTGAGPLIGDGITLHRTVLGDKPTAQGFVYIPFAGTEEGDSYVNIGIDINGDGAIASYSTASGTQEEWVVQNQYAEVVESEANRFTMKIVDEQFGANTIPGVALLSGAPFMGDKWETAWEEGAKEKKDFTITKVELEVRDVHMTLDPSGRLATGRPLTLGVAVAHAQGAPPAPLPGDYYARHMDVPDQNQLWNECAPTAIANSLRFLAKKYNVEDRMPKGDVNDLIDEIKGDVAWNDGVAHENIISGKTTFMKRHDLPFEAHQIGSTEDPDIVRKIADEIEKGQAIEAWLSFFDASGHPAGAHLVTVVGAGRKNGKDIVRFTDPDTIGAPSRDLYEVEGGNYLPNYWPGAQTYIRYAYAQSPTKELTDGTWVDPRGDTAIATGVTRPLTPAEEDVTLSRSQFGFFSTSIGHPGDHYVGDEFRVNVAVLKTGKSREVAFRNADGESSVWTHEAKKPWTLKGTFTASGAVTPARADDVPPQTSFQNDRFSTSYSFRCVSPGLATITYVADLGWTSSGEPPAEIKRFTHGTEFESTSDTMRVESPAFRCVAKPEVKKEESKIAKPATCPGVVEDPTSNPIMVLTQGVECYPALQFHQAGPDKCSETHWHANEGSARSLTGKTWVDPSGCGFGMIREVYTAEVRLSADQLAPYIQ